jgi:hypothetical protein
MLLCTTKQCGLLLGNNRFGLLLTLVYCEDRDIRFFQTVMTTRNIYTASLPVRFIEGVSIAQRFLSAFYTLC